MSTLWFSKPFLFGQSLKGVPNRLIRINLLFTMYAEQAHGHQPVQTFFPSKDTVTQVNTKRFGGAERDRTADPLLAKQVLSQLSYSPNHRKHPTVTRQDQQTSVINQHPSRFRANGGPGKT